MASTAYRKVTPSLCVAGSTENRPAIRPTYLPRSSSKNITNSTNQAGKSNSVSSIRSGRIRFAESLPVPLCAPNLQLKIVTPLAESPTPFEHLPSPLTTRLKHLNSPDTPPLSPVEVAPESVPLPPTPALLAISQSSTSSINLFTDSAPAAEDTDETRSASPVNPFSDSAPITSASPELRVGCDDINPFSDADADTTSNGSIISSISSNLTNEQTTFTSIVRVADSDADTSTYQDNEVIHDKELEAYAISLEQLYNPDVAGRQHRERAGPLYVMAAAMMQERFLSPLDLTEDEFVHLVLSQGNNTSQFLELNTRTFAHRMINRRKITQSELVKLGLPPSRLIEDFPDFYCTMSEKRQLGFKEACRRVVAFVRFVEKTLKHNDLMLDKLAGLALYERAPYYTSTDAISLALASVKADIFDIEDVLNMRSYEAFDRGCSSAESTRGGLQSEIPREIAEIFDRATKNFEPAGERFRLVRTRASLTKLLTKVPIEFPSPAADMGQSTSQFDGDAEIGTVDDSAAATSVANLLFESAPLSRLARFRFFVKSSLQHPFHRTAFADDKLNTKPEVDSGAEADSDTSTNTKSTAPSVDPTTPVFDRVVSPINSEQRTRTKGQERPFSADSGVALGLELQPSITQNNRTVRLKKSEVEDLQKVTGSQLDIRSIDDVFVDVPERQLENAQNLVKQVPPPLERSTSCFSLRRRNAIVLGSDGDVVVGVAEGEHGNKTLRKKLSDAFISRKQVSRRGSHRASGAVFKVFGRNGLPCDLTK